MQGTLFFFFVYPLENNEKFRKREIETNQKEQK